MRIRNIILLIVLLAAAAALLINRQTIGRDQIGVRLSSLGGPPTVYQTGQRVLLFPGLHHLILLTSKPIQFVMAGVGAIKITSPPGEPFALECKLRYQVTDPAALITTMGRENPQKAVEEQLRNQLTKELNARLEGGKQDLAQVQTRIMLTAETLQTLNQQMTPAGINLLSFELLSW